MMNQFTNHLVNIKLALYPLFFIFILQFTNHLVNIKLNQTLIPCVDFQNLQTT